MLSYTNSCSFRTFKFYSSITSHSISTMSTGQQTEENLCQSLSIQSSSSAAENHTNHRYEMLHQVVPECQESADRDRSPSLNRHRIRQLCRYCIDDLPVSLLSPPIRRDSLTSTFRNPSHPILISELRPPSYSAAFADGSRSPSFGPPPPDRVTAASGPHPPCDTANADGRSPFCHATATDCSRCNPTKFSQRLWFVSGCCISVSLVCGILLAAYYIFSAIFPK